MNAYRTIASPASAQYTEKRSRFIAHAVPVSTVEEAMARVEEYRKEYYDARHVCWAYRIGHEDEAEERSNDDGEPSGTAGKPILGQLLSYDLRDVLVVVVRYFGGVKLGTGGLIVAYRTAAAEALGEAEVQEHTLYTSYTLRFPYELINPVMMLLREHEVETLGNDADLEGYIWTVRVPNAGHLAFEEAAKRLYQLRVTALDE